MYMRIKKNIYFRYLSTSNMHTHRRHLVQYHLCHWTLRSYSRRITILLRFGVWMFVLLSKKQCPHTLPLCDAMLLMCLHLERIPSSYGCFLWVCSLCYCNLIQEVICTHIVVMWRNFAFVFKVWAHTVVVWLFYISLQYLWLFSSK